MKLGKNIKQNDLSVIGFASGNCGSFYGCGSCDPCDSNNMYQQYARARQISAEAYSSWRSQRG